MAPLLPGTQILGYPMSRSDWVAGFAAGEGCFSLYIGPHGCFARFAIKVRADDVGSLMIVADELGCGRIEKERVYRGTKEQRTLVVNRIEDLAIRVVPFFREHPLRAKKERDFAPWAEAVELLWEIQCRPRRERGRRWTDADRVVVADLAQQVKEAKWWGVR